MTGYPHNADQPSHGEAVISALFAALDDAGNLSHAERANILMTATTVILRELAQIPRPHSTHAIRTIHDLSTEYVNRAR